MLCPEAVFDTINLVSNASLTSSRCEITNIFLKRLRSWRSISMVACRPSSSRALNPSSMIRVSIFPLYPLRRAIPQRCPAGGLG